MGGIYKERRSVWFRCRDIHTELHKNWFRHSKVNRWDTQENSQERDRISLLEENRKIINM
jgi:hypothetical protein